MRFAWDELKNIENIKKHGISFGEALQIFNGSEEIEYDTYHSSGSEDRFRAYGWLAEYGRIVVVFIEFFEDEIRIISAYKV